MPRQRPPSDPVTLRFDGQAVTAERGEPVAVALVAAGHLALARSPKFHRPRGPACLRAACDGCLARVDGESNVMTCRVPADEGTRIETQNVVGSRDTDLLRTADWFFPDGMNHHELLAGIPGMQRVMQVLARRIAGIGRLPDEVTAPRAAIRRPADALVVGAGASGMAAALELLRRGRRVEVVDDGLSWGGGLRALAGPAAVVWEPLLRDFVEAVAASRLTLRLRTTAAGLYGDDLLLAGLDGLQVVNPRTLVLAPGAHDGVLTFEGNDVPGVMSARAAGWLFARGVTAGQRMVVVLAEGGGPFGEALAQAHPGTHLVRGRPDRVRGSGRVKEARVVDAAGERRWPCDTLLIDAPRAPAYELCAQAGAELDHQPQGFLVRVTKGGCIRRGVLAVGEVVGTPLDVAQVLEEARQLSDGI